MNKKLFVGATALTAVAVAGVVYYRYVQSTDRDVAQEIRERALRLFMSDVTEEEAPDDVWEPFKNVDKETYPGAPKEGQPHG